MNGHFGKLIAEKVQIMGPFANRHCNRAADQRASQDSAPLRTRAENGGRKGAVRSGPPRLGAAATEFAIVAPLFFLLVIGMIELGRGLMVEQILINASRVGARQAITVGATNSEVQTAVEDYATSVAVPSVSVNVTPDPASASAGTMVTVTTSVPFNNVSWLPSPWFLGGRTLTAASTMRKEGFE
jgi:TadE-like protein